MGTFLGHIVPGFAFALFGAWHVINTIRGYHLKGSSFMSRFWHPFHSPILNLKYLELILLLSFSVFAILMQILDFPFMRFSFKLDNFEHASMFLHVTIFACFTLFSELSQSSESLSGVSGMLAASVFGQELFLLYYHSADHVGLEGHYHWLLQLIVIVSLVSALSATSFPSSFPAALVLSISVVFQGCWLMNMGFMLWVPKFVAHGCTVKLSDASSNESMLGTITCETHDAGMRARALANLQFSWILCGILIFVGCLCLTFTRKFPFRGKSTGYEKLYSRGLDVTVAINSDKQVRSQSCMSSLPSDGVFEL